MEKITGIPGTPGFTKPETKQKTETDLFRKNLDQALKSQAAHQPLASGPGPLGEIQAVPTGMVQNRQEFLARKTEQLLSSMDRYAAELGSPSSTLRDVEPLLNQISKEAKELMEEAGTSLGQDDELYRIARKSAVTAGVEQVKFNRGDYL